MEACDLIDSVSALITKYNTDDNRDESLPFAIPRMLKTADANVAIAKICADVENYGEEYKDRIKRYPEFRAELTSLIEVYHENPVSASTVSAFCSLFDDLIDIAIDHDRDYIIEHEFPFVIRCIVECNSAVESAVKIQQGRASTMDLSRKFELVWHEYHHSISNKKLKNKK
jgi:hypothetical protein